jgi:hypothetical protein
MDMIKVMDKLWVLLALRHNYEMRVLANKVREGSTDIIDFYNAIAKEMLLFSEGQLLMSEKKYEMIPDWFDNNTTDEAKQMIISDLKAEMNQSEQFSNN